jgi:hypothetical protein
VLKWLLVTVLALGLAAGVATASLLTLSGTYRVTITGKPAPLNGKWEFKFLPRSAVRVVRNGKTVVFGIAVVRGSRVRFSDRSGSYACSAAEGTGTYVYSVVGKRLTFKAVADRCVGRKLILTTKPFVK